ncbi:acyl-[acyl-carrier-protein] thioesterase [Clostridium weizhouense]|uniref:Acyl-[acyl-carrier-protein] thioesterase n=1 Tax=Clostridium weizhouense TaxID=2859781 RepID=A0ABS7ATC9_9CLOT|nr:acyl-ACP thioesterase domain-containing protein [Clostridium weizhouense]MBW6411799.1 acyl-[acyl-carrier-protein] thioesterase [Clostridium weizhouense]
MGKSFSKDYEIHYYEVDYKLRCKLSSIIDFICDVGTHQSESVGGGMEYCLNNNCAWVFYKYDIKMYRYPKYAETINLTTQAVGFKRFYGLRKYFIRDSEGILIGEALALFFLINIEKRRPMRIQKEQYDFYGVDRDMEHNVKMDGIEKVDEEQFHREFQTRYSDIDSNKHVNNVKYIEWAMEAVPLEVVKDYELSRIKVIFEKETTYGDKISATATVEQVDENSLKSYHKIRNNEGIELTILEAEWKKVETKKA